MVREWIGSLDGSVNADVRARVSGYLISQNYKEGTLVHQGDLLFQIDPSTYEAVVEQAKSALALDDPLPFLRATLDRLPRSASRR